MFNTVIPLNALSKYFSFRELVFPSNVHLLFMMEAASQTAPIDILFFSIKLIIYISSYKIDIILLLLDASALVR